MSSTVIVAKHSPYLLLTGIALAFLGWVRTLQVLGWWEEGRRGREPAWTGVLLAPAALR